MKLDYAFLATAADQTPDGRLWIAGADFEALGATAVPVHAQFVLIAKIAFEPDEAVDHVLSLSVTGSTGETNILTEAIKNVVLAGDKSNTRFAKTIVTLSMTFENFGRYLFHLGVDGREITAVPLDIRQLNLEPVDGSAPIETN